MLIHILLHKVVSELRLITPMGIIFVLDITEDGVVLVVEV